MNRRVYDVVMLLKGRSAMHEELYVYCNRLHIWWEIQGVPVNCVFMFSELFLHLKKWRDTVKQILMSVNHWFHRTCEPNKVKRNGGKTFNKIGWCF